MPEKSRPWLSVHTIHPQLVDVVTHQHGPVLGRVRTLVDLLGDGPAQSSLLGEPLAGGPGDGVPTQLDDARVAVDFDVGRGHDVGFLAEAKLVFDVKGAFEEVVFAGRMVSL